MKIILTGGGTAGHVTPQLAIIPRLQADGHEVHYIGSINGMEKGLIESVPNVTYHPIHTGKLRRYFDVKNFTDVFRTLKGIREAGKVIKTVKPDVVFSKGGYVGLPVVIAARLHRVPALIHESDMTSGLANRLSKPFAKELLCTFPETAKAAGPKGAYVGAPIRDELLSGSRERGLKTFGFDDSKPVLLVTGGSSGAQAINRAVRGALHSITSCFQVLHICGEGNVDALYEGVRGYVQVTYLKDEMADALACADVVVSRAGSNTICELLALRKPAVLVPYPTGASRGDQEINAASFQRRGYARVLEQSDMTSEALYRKIIEVYKDRGELIESMSREPHTNANKKIIEHIYACAKK